MKQLERLAEMEFPLCKILGEETVILPIYKRQEVPSEDALKEFLYIIQKMKAKQVNNVHVSIMAYSNNFRQLTKQTFLL